MAVVVGTDVYLSVAAADTYWSDRNNSTWAAATAAAKEKALREATQYLDGKYKFIGALSVYTQLLAWPRSGAEITTGNFTGAYYDNVTIPPQIESACAELALEALSARLQPVAARGGAIKKEKVDVIEVEYMDFAPSQTTYSFVTSLMSGLIIGGGNNVKLVRV